jgi:four helix bundle protein
MLQLAHKKLEVYKLSLLFTKEVYRLTKQFPKEELFVLVSQIRRAAISVISNLAEGSSRISKSEKKRFYEIARSSLVEVDTQFELTLILGYLQSEQITLVESYMQSISRMLTKMIVNFS